METLSAILMFTCYGLMAFLAFKFYTAKKDELNTHFAEVWNSFPEVLFDKYSYLIYVISILLIISISFLGFTYLFIWPLWLILLFVLPFMILPIVDRNKYNIISGILFLISTAFSISFFFNLDSIRDIIGESMTDRYHVYYTEEFYVDSNGEGQSTLWPNLNTGSKSLDIFFTYGFPVIHKLFFTLCIYLSLRLKLSLGHKNLIISQNNNSSSLID